VVVVGVLGLGLLGGSFYLLYHAAYNLTSPTAATIPTFDGGDDVYNGAEQKITDFNHNVQQNQPASLHLSADEINTLLARDAGISGLNIHVFVTITGDQAAVQFSCPVSATPLSVFKDRYLNGDGAIGLNFDPGIRAVHVTFHSFTLGSQAVPESELSFAESEFNPLINVQLQSDPNLKNVVDHARTIAITGGELVVETN
jgi:hypothetical protein